MFVAVTAIKNQGDAFEKKTNAMKYLVTSLLLLSTAQLQAQTWKLNLETGATLSRLLPGKASTQGGSLSYGYSRPGVYIAPEVQLKIT